jgi:pyruvate/oxaloacetate carboxyltransferase
MVSKLSVTKGLLAIFLSAGLSAALPAYAQKSDQAKPGASSGTTEEMAQAIREPRVSRDDLENFANVNIKAQEIQAKYKPQLDSAKNMDDVQKVAQQMNGELIDAIHSQDLSIAEYKQVSLAVMHNAALHKRFTAIITEKMQP